MSNAEKLQVLNSNRALIDVFAELKNIAICTRDKKILKALKLIDSATEILSDV